MLRAKMKKKAAEKEKAEAASIATTDETVVNDGGDAEKAKEIEANPFMPQGVAVSAKKKKPKLCPGEIRMAKDIAELDAGDVAVVTYPNNDLKTLCVTITPNTGYWQGGRYVLMVSIPSMYPHEAPKVVCETPIYHPNIDVEGKVCLNILRDDWKPVLDFNAVIYGLCFLFYTPNPDDPLNREAAKSLRENPANFKEEVKRTMRGGSFYNAGFGNRKYPRFL